VYHTLNVVSRYPNRGVHILQNTVTIEMQVRVVPYVHVQHICQDTHRRGEESPGRIAAAIVRSKRARNTHGQEPPANNNKKKKKKSRNLLDEEDDDDDKDQPQSQTTGTSSTGLQQSASTNSRASESGSAHRVGSAASAEQRTDPYTSPKTMHNVYVSSAERVPPNKRSVQKKSPHTPHVQGIQPDPINGVSGPEKDMLTARVVEATNDITPRLHGPKVVPFLYWETHQPTLCAVQLITRFPDLVAFAEAHYHGVPQMAHRWAAHIRTKANNERATQIRSVKDIWVNSYSKFAIAYTYIPDSKDTSEDEPDEGIHEVLTITETVRDSGIGGIEELRALLRSDAMYKNSVVYSLFCQGLESGELKHSKRLPPTTISSLITIAHEAHFRLELWFSLSKPDFAHTSKVTHMTKRKELFLAFCKFVKQDRLDNEAQAHAQRLASEELDAATNDTSAALDSSYY